jgi:hypothetical protein
VVLVAGVSPFAEIPREALLTARPFSLGMQATPDAVGEFSDDRPHGRGVALILGSKALRVSTTVAHVLSVQLRFRAQCVVRLPQTIMEADPEWVVVVPGRGASKLIVQRFIVEELLDENLVIEKLPLEKLIAQKLVDVEFLVRRRNPVVDFRALRGAGERDQGEKEHR